jgi:hypothetical protein
MQISSRHIWVLIAAGLLAGCNKAPPADEQVFGVRMGDAVTSLDEARPLEEPPLFNYAFRPKEAMPPFSEYAALATPAAGVCAVRARATDTVPDIQALLDSLRKKYGRESSNSAVHSYYWFPDAAVPPTSAAIQTIALTDLGTMVSLTYTFKNMGACQKELGVNGPPQPAPSSE